MTALAIASRRPGPATATVLIMASSLCVGTTPLFARALLAEGMTAEAIALYRFLISLALTAPFFPRQPHKLRPALWLIGTGYLMGLGWAGYIRALDVVPVASAGVIYMSYPLFVLIFARLLVGQPLTGRALASAALVLGAAALALAPAAPDGAAAAALIGCLAAPAAFGLIIVVLTTVASSLGVMERLCCGALGAVAGLLPAVLAGDPGALMPASSQGWALVLVMGLVTAALPQFVYVFAAPFIGPTRTAAAGSVELPMMIAIGWLAFAETVGWAQVVAAALVVTAIVVAPALRPGAHRS
jgi:drug/metabolite transporter (DMT)-like permease